MQQFPLVAMIFLSAHRVAENPNFLQSHPAASAGRSMLRRIPAGLISALVIVTTPSLNSERMLLIF
jgi:hypothetical protein